MKFPNLSPVLSALSERCLDRVLEREGEEIEMSTKIDPNAARRLGVRRFDASGYLRDEADIAVYLEAAAAEGDPRILAAALGDIARAREDS